MYMRIYGWHAGCGVWVWDLMHWGPVRRRVCGRLGVFFGLRRTENGSVVVVVEPCGKPGLPVCVVSCARTHAVPQVCLLALFLIAHCVCVAHRHHHSRPRGLNTFPSVRTAQHALSLWIYRAAWQCIGMPWQCHVKPKPRRLSLRSA